MACRPFAWQWEEPQGDDGGPLYEGVRRGEITANTFSGSEYGGVGSWTIKLDHTDGNDQETTITVNP